MKECRRSGADFCTIKAWFFRLFRCDLPLMSQTPNFNTLIFDIGDVLFSWSSNTKTSISSKTLRQILACPTWFEYERGKISQDDCYAKVGSEFSLPIEEIRQAFIEARESLQSNDARRGRQL